MIRPYLLRTSEAAKKTLIGDATGTNNYEGWCAVQHVNPWPALHLARYVQDM